MNNIIWSDKTVICLSLFVTSQTNQQASGLLMRFFQNSDMNCCWMSNQKCWVSSKSKVQKIAILAHSNDPLLIMYALRWLQCFNLLKSVTASIPSSVLVLNLQKQDSTPLSETDDELRRINEPTSSDEEHVQKTVCTINTHTFSCNFSSWRYISRRLKTIQRKHLLIL